MQLPISESCQLVIIIRVGQKAQLEVATILIELGTFYSELRVFPKSLNIGKAVDAKLGNEREVVGTKSCGYQVSISKTRKEQGYRPNETNATTEVVVDRGNTEHEGWGTALKPAHEPIVMARKPLSESSIVGNVLKHGTGGINIDGCRIETNPEVDDMHRVVDRKPRNDDKVWTNKNSGFKNENSCFDSFYMFLINERL